MLSQKEIEEARKRYGITSSAPTETQISDLSPRMQRLTQIAQQGRYEQDPRAALAEQQSAPPQKDGFFKSLVKDPIKTLIVKPGVRATQAGIAAFGGERGREFAEKDYNIHIPLLGDYNIESQKPGGQGAKQIVGDAAKSASYLVPAGKAAAGVKGAVVQGVKQGALSGGLASGGAALQDNKSLGTVAKDVAIGSLVGGATGAAISGTGAALGKISGAGKESAINTYSKALSPTTKENKAITEKIAPELIKRKVFAFTRKGLLDKAGARVETAGDALEAGYDALPQGAKVEFTPVLTRIEKLKGDTIVNGVVLDKAKFKALDTLQQDLLRAAGGTDKASPAKPQVSIESARRARAVLDSITKRSGKGFGYTATDTAALEANKGAADAIRNELAQEYPSIARLNKEFNFWSNVKKVIGDTVTRTRGQNPISETIAEGAGAIAGATAKGTMGSVLLTATGLKLLKQGLQSTGFRTASAILKDRLATALAEGNNKVAQQILQRIISGNAGRAVTSPSGEEPIDQ